MNYKMLILLGGVFVALVAAFFLVQPDRPEIGGQSDLVGKPLVKGFKPDDVRVIKLTKGDRSIELARKDGKWVVSSKNDRPVDADRVKILLEGIRDAKVKESRPGSPELFELDEPQRLCIRVTGSDDQLLADIVAGKSTKQFRGNGFVLKDDWILEVIPNLRDRAQLETRDDKKVLSLEKWYDLKLLRVASSDVIDVSFEKDGKKWRIQKVIPGEGPVKPKSKEELAKAEEAKKADAAKKDDAKGNDKKAEEKEEKKGPVWRITAPEEMEANQSECSSVCSAISWLDSKGYADDLKPEELGFDKPTATTRFVLKDGTTHTFVFGKVVEKDGETFALTKLDDRPQVWKVGKYDYQNITKPIEKLKQEEEEQDEEPKKAAPKAEEKDGRGK